MSGGLASSMGSSVTSCFSTLALRSIELEAALLEDVVHALLLVGGNGELLDEVRVLPPHAGRSHADPSAWIRIATRCCGRRGPSSAGRLAGGGRRAVGGWAKQSAGDDGEEWREGSEAMIQGLTHVSFLWVCSRCCALESAVGSARGCMGDGMGAEISWLISSSRASSDSERCGRGYGGDGSRWRVVWPMEGEREVLAATRWPRRCPVDGVEEGWGSSGA